MVYASCYPKFVLVADWRGWSVLTITENLHNEINSAFVWTARLVTLSIVAPPGISAGSSTPLSRSPMASSEMGVSSCKHLLDVGYVISGGGTGSPSK